VAVYVDDSEAVATVVDDFAAFGEALGILLGGGGVAAFGQSFLTKARGQLTGGNTRPADPDK